MGFITNIKNMFKSKGRALVKAEMLNGNTSSVFTSFNCGAYANDIYREGVDAIARNVGKLKGAHIVNYDGIHKTGTDTRLNRCLQVAPNAYMTAYDMLYKLTTHYYLYNNCFAFLNRNEKGDVVSIYPITCTQADFLADDNGTLYIQFHFRNGKEFTARYSDVIHLRRHFNSDELLGDSNEAVIPALELAHAENEGIINGIRSGAQIRGILKYTQIMSDEKLKADKEAFIADYLDVSNNGGIVATDSKADYTPISSNPTAINAEETKETKTKIYNYLGITEAIVNSSYTEDEYGAFYESVIEPLALQLSLEFTRKIFNERERAYGNEIVFESGRVIYSNNNTRLQMIKELVPYGLLTVNEAREILNLAPVEDGDKRLQTLNVVDASKANAYQLEENETGAKA
nr:MAG TPA: portal protein [Caudoviricetes sp.]